MTVPEIRTLRLNNTVMERNYDYGLEDEGGNPTSTVGANRTPQRDIASENQATMRARAPEVARLSPERSMQLLEIFVPSRLDFYRQPIPEEAKEPEPSTSDDDRAPKMRGAAADLFAARMQQQSAEKAKALQAIYGSVSAQDILAAVRAVMGTNEESARVLVAEEDITFVEENRAASVEEGGRIKHVGDYVVEIKIKGAEEGIRRLIKVHAQEV